ncbi:Gfo/Idh/MocA family oxidoreductase [Chitinophaga horti]|uniref:Gfo/Idh/MocA family oxidoreductase n=1 Tax=Chitinophaga horti TaxID=2920382 RepID=A0ABY6J8T1_9BACT|nr:Gfo/Idh/MocA family oxidoreductase [Chitinophaga horti]UYQ94691.1 Gfo/Idh/MocA family oxidoreductase [Chitinophaga horti]
MHRRDFLFTSAKAGVAWSALPLLSSFKRTESYKLALIGSGWWGMNILRCALKHGGCKLVAISDVDTRQSDKAMQEINKLTSDRPRVYKDYRELLHKEKPEIVIVATPDHWHPLITIAAIEQGAHVYVEKPISHTILEGQAMVNAARKHGKIVQVGMHRRVSPHNMSGMDFLKSGKAGKIGMVRAFVHYPGGAGKPVPNEEAPKELDWNMWCGPAPLNPYNPAIHPKGFRNFLDYANGTLGDWGIHWMDQILWWTEEKHPRKIYSSAARHIKKDNTDAPDTQNVIFEFESFTATWEHRTYAGNEAEKTNIGCYYYGTEGTFHMGWLDGWTFYPSDKNKQPIHQAPQLDLPDQQNIAGLWANFMTCIEKRQTPVCDIEIGQRSTNMSLLGMLSHKVGRSIVWDGKQVVQDDEANKLLKRAYRGEWKYPV